MCEPVTLGLIAAGTGLAGSALSASGQYQEGQYAAGVARQNQQLAYAKASDAVARGELAAGRVALKAGQIEGEQRTAAGASGVEGSVGTAANVMADSRMMSALDQATLRNNATREAWGYKVEAANYGTQADLDERRGLFGAAGTFLGGLGSAARTASQF